RQRYRQHLAGGLSHLDPAPRAARRERRRARGWRAIGNLDHWSGKRDGHDEARRAWLEGGAQSRGPARAVIDHRPTDEDVREPNGAEQQPGAARDALRIVPPRNDYLRRPWKGY